MQKKGSGIKISITKQKVGCALPNWKTQYEKKRRIRNSNFPEELRSITISRSSIALQHSTTAFRVALEKLQDEKSVLPPWQYLAQKYKILVVLHAYLIFVIFCMAITLFRPVKTTLKSVHICDKITQMGQNRPIFRVLCTSTWKRTLLSLHCNVGGSDWYQLWSSRAKFKDHFRETFPFITRSYPMPNAHQGVSLFH